MKWKRVKGVVLGCLLLTALFIAFHAVRRIPGDFSFNVHEVRGYFHCNPRQMEQVTEQDVSVTECFHPALPEGTSEPIFVTFLNKAWIQMAKNWVCSAKRVGLEGRLYLIGMEEGVCKSFTDVPCYQLPGKGIREGQFGQLNYQHYMIERTKLIIRVLSCSQANVVFADGDIVFIKNPIHHLDLALKGNDAVFQGDSTGLQAVDTAISYVFSYICAGFMYIRPNIATKHLFQSVLSYQESWNWNDQAGINLCIHHHSQSLSWKLLDKAYFPNGKEYFEFNPDNPDAVIVHANFILHLYSKQSKLHAKGLWCVSDLTSHNGS